MFLFHLACLCHSVGAMITKPIVCDVMHCFKKGFSTALDNKMMHNMHQIGIMMCVNIVAQIFENTL